MIQKKHLKKIGKLAMCCMMVGMLFASEGFFTNNEWGARPVGLGGSFVAIADDVNSVVWNPAGMARLDQIEATFMYSKPYSVVDFGANYLALVYPLKEQQGVVGGAILNYSYPEQASENVYLVSYAQDIAKYISQGGIKNLYVGLSVKYMSVNILANDIDTTNYNTSKTGITADVGVLYPVNANISLGAMVKNLIEPDFTFRKSPPSGYEKNYIMREIIAGVGYSKKEDKGEMNLAASIVSYSGGTDIQLGGEYWIKAGENSLIGVRAGYNPKKYSIGLSYKPLKPSLSLDFVYTIPSGLKEAYGWNVAIVYTFSRI